MQDKDFKLHSHKGFTLVLHKYQEVEQQINTIIKPHNGKVIFSDAYITKIMMPVLKDLMAHVYKK